jgi:hypothetical protein
VGTEPAANAIASIVSGRMRRQSSVGTSTMSTIAHSQRQGTSGLAAASMSTSGGSTATSSQSRQTRRGGGGWAAGASQSARTGLVMPLMIGARPRPPAAPCDG